MPLSTLQGSECLHYLKSQYNTTLQEFITIGIGLSDDPMGTLTEVLQTLLECEQWGNEAKECILQVAKEQYNYQLGMLASKSSGWHFSALKAKSDKIEKLDIGSMITDMQQIAPDLCTLVEDLMSADKKLIARRMDQAALRERKAAERKAKRDARHAREAATADGAGGHDQLLGEDDDIWNLVPDIDIELVDAFENQYWTQDFEPHMPEDPSDDASAHDEDRARERRVALTKIVRTLDSITMSKLTNNT